VAAFNDPAGATPQSVWNILYLLDEFGAELKTRLDSVDMDTAVIATSKYTELREPLRGLGLRFELERSCRGVGLEVNGMEESLNDDFGKLGAWEKVGAARARSRERGGRLD
jgi:hypothetical protein